MTAAAKALLKALHQRLSGDPALSAIIGPDGVRDRLLPRPQLPAITFGDLDTRDYSTDGDGRAEHLLTLEIWSDGEGRRQGQETAGLVHDLLHDVSFDLGSVVLVSLLVTGMRSRREPKTKFYLVEMRLRAVTE
ncbi:DUF3168 domain-containing protein [Rhizobium deserti]|uniref:DUF3168 domain-containing protein n=1 Tax=Rhizobium deserti TaxID=2547961 RepID=A0A4R5UKE1_9HYPH|nr:DUF3168 domain-containing protein [Rhizobium deserti]TDK37239.1 DUF3168 domain-containing protein [Rhizobium deserti]